MGLKKELEEIMKEEQYITRHQFECIVKTLRQKDGSPYSISNAERRMRESKMVEAIQKDDKPSSPIKAYEYIGKDNAENFEINGIFLTGEQQQEVNKLPRDKANKAIKIARDASWVDDKYRYFWGVYNKLSTSTN
jgi:hypothetical protein